MYSFSISRQALLFLYSLGFGFALGVLYDMSKITRRLLFGKRFLPFQDIAFFVLAAPLTFLFLLIFDFGCIRFYTVSAILIGYFTFSFSFAGVMLDFADRIVDKFRAVLGVILRPVVAVFRLIGSKSRKVATSASAKTGKLCKKAFKKQKLIENTLENL